MWHLYLFFCLSLSKGKRVFWYVKPLEAERVKTALSWAMDDWILDWPETVISSDKDIWVMDWLQIAIPSATDAWPEVWLQTALPRARDADLPTPKYFCQYPKLPVSVFSDFLPLPPPPPPLFCGCTTTQNRKVSMDNFSIIYLVRKVCELTCSILQTQHKLAHYDSRTPLFCLQVLKSLWTIDRRTLSPKGMHRVWCFCWCWRTLFRMVVWSEPVSLVSCILSPFISFVQPLVSDSFEIKPAISLTSIKLQMQCWCPLDSKKQNKKLLWPIRTSRILQLWKWLEVMCMPNANVSKWLLHQRLTIHFPQNELVLVHNRISVVSWTLCPYVE